MSKLNHTPGKWHYVDYSPQFNGCFPVYDIRDDWDIFMDKKNRARAWK